MSYKKGLVQNVFYDLCSRVDSPVSLGLWLRYRDAPSELAAATIDPLAYNDPATFFADYTCLAFLRKYVGLATGIDLEGVAILKFRELEEKCQQTNDRLRKVRTTSRSDWSHEIELTRNLIARIWGRPNFCQLFDRCAWGPGSTASLSGSRASVEYKMSTVPLSVTPLALPYLKQVLKYDVHWTSLLLRTEVSGPVSLPDDCFDLVNSSRLLTVPKDAKTNRTIAAEPTANIFLQKGVGDYLRSRLRRFGINLDDQSRNQNLAGFACRSGLATLDLSAASDSISVEVIKLLCPVDMFDTLYALRTPAYAYDGVESSFHKFSSMGNGYTFELESVLFYAAICACVDESDYPLVGVYGDDLVLPAVYASKVVAYLDFLGFSTNKSKSFVSGQFYESCGKHYFSGVDVTPVFQKKCLTDDLEVIRFFNRLKTLEKSEAASESFSRSLSAIHRKYFKKLPDRLRKYQGFAWFTGDGFFHLDDPVVPYSLHTGFTLRYLKDVRRPSRIGDLGIYAYALRLANIGRYTDCAGLDFWRPGRGRPVIQVRSRTVPASYRNWHCPS